MDRVLIGLQIFGVWFVAWALCYGAYSAWKALRKKKTTQVVDVDVRILAATEAGKRTARLMGEVLGIVPIAAVDPCPHQDMVFTASHVYEYTSVRLHLTGQCPTCNRYGWESAPIRVVADLHTARTEMTVARCRACGSLYSALPK